MMRRKHKVEIPQEPKPCVEEVIVPPVDDVIEKTQVKIMEVPNDSSIVTFPLTPLFKVRFTYPNVNKRAEPRLSAKIVGQITDMGVYEIYREQDGWGQMKDESWSMLQYSERV